ncbi:hypothetical protein C9I98_08135 [Photobacterium sanctipauli]|uniref:Porin n=1 Tax=Photobacterium sanctipauli TaxID=1342794 RepID=A0A2T3NWX8_9GAMM|nr:hypothetical protein [Photobacterium sanctipauli]PSW20797.1 hypothetical protein C9I98_08135 [Photobacterium sanctipauli]
MINNAKKIVVLSSLLSAPVLADYVEFGAELERYNSEYSGDDINMPYVGFNVTPFANSPFNISGHSSYAARLEEASNGGNRNRQEFFIGYRWDFGDLTFAPTVGVRHESFNSGTDVKEYRIFPGLTYNLSDESNIYLGGFVAPVSANDRDRSENNSGSLESYTDWKHELELGYSSKLASGDSYKVSFYNEYQNKSDIVREGAEDNRNELQLRLQYQYQASSEFSVKPWARIGLYREKEDANGQIKEDIRHRAGFDTSYKFNQDWSMGTRLYAQMEERHDWDGTSNEDKWRYYFKFSIRRTF